jgi:hypothetical protein
MTEIKDPGAPRTDELARNAALHALADTINDGMPHSYDLGYEDFEVAAKAITDTHSVTWERDVNGAGVPVRRYVMWSEWTVDPERRSS